MVTWDEGQSDGVMIDGIRVFKMCRRDAGVNVLRFFYPRWTSLWHALRKADADIYYYNCGDLGLGQVVMWCQKYRRKSVYSVASDPDCDRRLPKLKPMRERILFTYGLRNADRVIVQTEQQRRMLREGCAVNSTVVPMPCEGFSETDCGQARVIPRRCRRIIWVGRISKEKRLEWLLEVAERCPDISFDVVGAANSDSEYASTLMRRAAGIPNVKMHGRVSHGEMVGYYRHCLLLCCTSIHEGFPNTFLEAWSCGVPVVSTFDPDGIVAERKLGWVASDVGDLITGLRTAVDSPDAWEAASRAARSYYMQRHTLDVVMPQFEQLFRDVFHGREWRP